MKKIIINIIWTFLLFVQHLRFFLFLNKNKEVILILTPGKVASTSVYKTLKKHLKSKYYIFHLHFLSNKNIKRGIKIHKNSKRGTIPYHFITSKIVKKYFLKNNMKLNVITILRDPVSRLISDYFQNSDRIYKNINEISNKQIVDEINLMIDKRKHLLYLEDWLENELEYELGININDINKNKEKYYFEKNKKYNFLILNVKDLNNIFSSAIKEIFNINIKLQDSNRSSEKIYNKKYLEVKELFLSQKKSEIKDFKYKNIYK